MSLERAARAIAREHYARKKHVGACGVDARIDWLVDRYWANFTLDARAVILSLREPSEAMQAAAGGHYHSGLAGHIWQVMIDVALEEG